MNNALVPVRVVVDDREEPSGLPRLLAARWIEVEIGRLPTGDVEIGDRVLVERKTVRDFVASTEDNRLFEQLGRIVELCARPLLVVEGIHGWPARNVSPGALRGLLAAIAVAFRVPMLRTSDVAETATLLAQIARQESRRIAQSSRATQAANPRRVSLDILGMIPGIGDLRARRLLDRFGSVADVLSAEDGALREVPDVGPKTADEIRRLAPPSTAPPKRDPSSS